MATTQIVSMSEINRVAPWSLRALGQPFGVAERGTRLLTWTQAAVGHALELLRIGEDHLRRSAQAPAAQRSGDMQGGRRIDACGRNLIELGPPAVDLVTCDARLVGQGSAVVENAIGTLMTPSLADLLARRGLNAVVGYRAGPDDVPIPGWPPEGWIAAFTAPSGAAFAAGGSAGLPHVAELFDGAMRLHVREHARMLAEAARAGTALVTLAATTAAPRGIERVGSTVDYTALVAQAYREGLEVAEEDLAHLYALERITWAPTSGRSRKQAGY